MLVSMKSILEDANDCGYAVMAMNCVNIETARGCVEAAVEESSPIIVQISVR